MKKIIITSQGKLQLYTGQELVNNIKCNNQQLQINQKGGGGNFSGFLLMLDKQHVLVLEAVLLKYIVINEWGGGNFSGYLLK